jgi:hypothetical protein
MSFKVQWLILINTTSKLSHFSGFQKGHELRGFIKPLEISKIIKVVPEFS